MRTTTGLVVTLALGLGACAGTAHDSTTKEPSASVLRELAREVAFTRVARELERQLFSTPDEILEMCAAPIDFAPERMAPVRRYLKQARLDTTIVPTVSCLFVATGDGSTTLYTYAPVVGQGYYVLREQQWFDPGGTVAVAKHPFHLTSYSRPEWNLPRENFDRVVLSPLASLPFNQNTELTLRVTEEDGSEHSERIWVDRTFEIRRGDALVERFHVIVRDYGAENNQDRVRKWYLYSDRANTVIRQVSVPIGVDSAARRFGGQFANTDIHGLAYIQNGQFSFVVSSVELGPLRAYLGDFDVWKSR